MLTSPSCALRAITHQIRELTSVLVGNKWGRTRKKSVMNLFIDNTCYMKWWSFFSGICSLLYCEHGRNTQLLLGNHLNCLSGRLAKIAVSKCLQSTVTFCIKAFVRTARLSQSLLKDTASYRLIVHNKINSLHYVLATIHQTKLFRAWNLAEELKS